MRVCEIAGFLLFEPKAAKVLKTLGFSGVPRSGTLFEKNFWFSVVPCGCFVYQLVWENVLSLYLDKGAPFWGVFWEKLCKCASFFSRVMPYAPVKSRSATLHGCSPKGSLTLLPQHEGRKNDTLFQIFSKFFSASYFCPASTKDCRLCRPCLQNG